MAFSIDDHAVRESELNRKLALSLQPFYESIYNAKLAGARREIAQRLISEEATKQSVPVDALLAKEVFSKIKVPDAETGKSVSPDVPFNGGSEVWNNTKQQVAAQLAELFREQLVARLAQEHRVSNPASSASSAQDCRRPLVGKAFRSRRCTGSAHCVFGFSMSLLCSVGCCLTSHKREVYQPSASGLSVFSAQDT